MNLSDEPSIPQPCLQCQAPLTGRNMKKFCSRQCSAVFRAETNRVHLICATCGIKFYKPIYRTKDSGSGLYFCCNEHRSQALASGILPTRARKQTNNYYRGNCAYCGEVMRSSSPFVGDTTHRQCRLPRLISLWLSGDNNITLVQDKITGVPKSTKNFVKEHLLETRGDRCERCGFSEHGPFGSIIQMDHINGNCFDNRPDNLKLLCPNCHAMTETWGSRNKGSNHPHKRIR